MIALSRLRVTSSWPLGKKCRRDGPSRWLMVHGSVTAACKNRTGVSYVSCGTANSWFARLPGASWRSAEQGRWQEQSQELDCSGPHLSPLLVEGAGRMEHHQRVVVQMHFRVLQREGQAAPMNRSVGAGRSGGLRKKDARSSHLPVSRLGHPGGPTSSPGYAQFSRNSRCGGSSSAGHLSIWLATLHAFQQLGVAPKRWEHTTNTNLNITDTPD